MALEYAVTRWADGRNAVTTREDPRPESVRATAHRMNRWRDAREGCQLCRAENAVAVRAGMAVCGACRSNMAQRIAGFEGGLRAVPVLAEQRADTTGLSGLAIVFNSLSVDLGGFYERVAPEAVDRTIAEGIDVVQLVDHDVAKPIGRLSAGTLRIRKTPKGLANTVSDPPNTTVGRDTVVSVQRREITSQSFGFNTLADDWELDGDLVVRTLLDMRVLETSIVLFPAYRTTSIDVQDGAQRDIDFMRKVHRTRLAAN